MASVAHNLMKFFRSSSNQTAASETPQKLSRRSSGVGEISRVLNSQEGLCVLDVGATSATNIRFFTGKGHKNYSEDLLRSSLDPALRVQDELGSKPYNPALCNLYNHSSKTSAVYDSAYCHATVTTPQLWLYGAAWAIVALVVGFVFFWQAETRYGRG